MSPSRILVLLSIPVLAAACGGSSPQPASSAAPPDTSVQIKTATVTVGGQSKTVLTDGSGLTLYWYSPDYANKVNCLGTCASNWPPVLAPLGDPVPAKGVSLPGKLSAILGGNGRQVEYNGHPLYRFLKDSAPGQATGQGLSNGQWQVATPDLTAASPAPTPTPS